MSTGEARRGILLAGGRGTRLYPLTASTSKQLVAVYNKPMVYYPLTTMMMSGVREVLIISSPDMLPHFRSLFGDGAALGMDISYAPQDSPRGIAEAFIIGAGFVAGRRSMLMLGDNIIYGRLDFLRSALVEEGNEAIVFGYQVSDPSQYGVIDFDSEGRVVDIQEKPANPRSHWAVPGIYFYPPGVEALASGLEPSDRGELEITDLNRHYLDSGMLRAIPMGRGIAWFDTGTPQALLEAGNFIEAIERRQGLIVGSPEEVAFRMGFIDVDGLARAVAAMPDSHYRSYLQGIVDEQ